jgi:hypothetical protein
MDNIKLAINQINDIAKKIEPKNKSLSNKVRVYAQNLSDMQSMNEFDPSQEYGSDMQGYDMQGGSQDVQPFASDDTPSGENPVNMETTIGGETEKVPIESFVRQPDAPVAPANYKIHTCTVMFKAPLDIEESDMMNYILGIGDKLGVDVDSFKWTKSDANKSGSEK